MQKIVFRIFLSTIAYVFTLCSPAQAQEWLIFDTAPEGSIYINPSSIRKEGSRAEMWVLIDYKMPQPDKTGKQVLSDKLHYQYDCKAKQFSIIETSAHAGPMGSGETININPDPPQLTAVPENSTAEKMWERACRIKLESLKV